MTAMLRNLALALAALLMAATAARAADTADAAQAREYMIKAAFVYNFAKYTSWPDTAFAGSAAPLRLCVLGRDPFGPALDMVSGKSVGNRPVVVARIARVQAARGCHILFVSAAEAGRMTAILRALRDRPVLTVGDSDAFDRAGGIIRLKTVRNKVRFEINRHIAKAAGLRLSARLLQLATAVSDTQPQSQLALARYDAPR